MPNNFIVQNSATERKRMHMEVGTGSDKFTTEYFSVFRLLITEICQRYFWNFQGKLDIRPSENFGNSLKLENFLLCLISLLTAFLVT